MYEIKYSAYLDEESFPSLHLPAGAGKCSPGRPGEVDVIDLYGEHDCRFLIELSTLDGGLTLPE